MQCANKVINMLLNLMLPLNQNQQWFDHYLNNQHFWVEDVLSWDDSINLALSDHSIFTLLFSSVFTKSYVSIDYVSKFSFLDSLITNEGVLTLESQELYTAVFCDLFSPINSIFYPFQFIFYTDSQTAFSIILQDSPELLLAISDFLLTYVNPSVLSYMTTVASIVFSDFTSSLILNSANFLLLFVFFIWFNFFFFLVLRLTSWNNTLESYLSRLTLYFYSLSRENRLQFESTILTVLLFTVLFALNITTFKDMYQEPIEALNTFLFKLFLLIYLFFLYKNSIHYFSFLEASVSDRGVLSMFIQFVKDFANSFVLLLRFITLLFRLNIYDAVDDVLDSNYIFICDFEDDSFYVDFFGTFYKSILINNDSFGDKTIFLESSLDFSGDLFFVYFILCGKLISFIFFALEEIGRVLLAFFIIYLVIFEMQSVNRSYDEHSFTRNIESFR